MHVQGALDLDTVVAQVLDSLAETSGVRRAGLALSEGGGRRLRFTASDRDVVYTPGRHVELDWCHIDAFEDVPLVDVVRTGRPVVGAVEVLEERYPFFARTQHDETVAAVAAMPLTTGGTTWGAVVLSYDLLQRFDHDQLALLDSVVARVATEIGVAHRVSPADAALVGGAEVSAEVSAEATGDDATVSVEVDPAPISVALSRRFARRHLQAWAIDADVLDTVVLCLSELVTNVVMHAATTARIELRREPTRVVVTVRDTGTTRRASSTALDADPLLVHGRGLQLVEAMADEWGSDSGPGGTTVWCAFAVSRAAT